MCSFQASLCPSEETLPCPQPSLCLPASHDLKDVSLACRVISFPSGACEGLIHQDLHRKLQDLAGYVKTSGQLVVLEQSLMAGQTAFSCKRLPSPCIFFRNRILELDLSRAIQMDTQRRWLSGVAVHAWACLGAFASASLQRPSPDQDLRYLVNEVEPRAETSKCFL